MRVLHISNDFNNTPVHRNLYAELDLIGIEQIIYNPLRSNNQIGRNSIEFQTTASEVVYSTLLKRIHSLVYATKRKFLFSDIEKKVELNQIDLMVATTLFSDGGVAYMLKRKYKIPYLIAIRATDIHVFLEKRPDLIFYAKKILKNASGVIFISPSLLKKFQNNKLVNRYIGEQYKPKYSIIPNGISDFWLDNLRLTNELKDPIRLIYVGRLIRRKYIDHIIYAIDLLRSKGHSIEFDIIGDGGEQAEEIKELSVNRNHIHCHGQIKDKDLLMDYYRKANLFIMPSQGETFGLVYIEALSQGLPVMYSSNEGIDGYFKNSVGKAVNSVDVNEIASGIETMIKDYPEYQPSSVNFEVFRWNNIARKYLELYKKSIL